MTGTGCSSEDLNLIPIKKENSLDLGMSQALFEPRLD